MSKTEQRAPTLFLDFDGTITQRDVIDAILETYADARWMEIEKQWRACQIGSRACLQAQMALVRATQNELDALIDAIEIDEGFLALLDTCARHSVAAYIVSDGFDYCIHRILERPQLDFARHNFLRGVRVCASHLKANAGTRWDVGFPYFPRSCAHNCATCKPSVMRLLNPGGAPSIFVGDGLSDKYAAQVADCVFAKKNLAAYCESAAIAYRAYENLAEVAAQLDALLYAEKLKAGDEAATLMAPLKIQMQW
jgi:2,3-diketo-5-methylthio-1-phosphopentane phosphatase